MIELITAILTVLTIILAPILILYALVVWHEQHDSKAVKVMIALATLLTVRAITNPSNGLLSPKLNEFIGATSLALAMILLIFSLRAYVHASLKSAHSKNKRIQKKKRRTTKKKKRK